MFKVSNNDSRTTPCSTVSIVNFEQVNAGREFGYVNGIPIK